MNLPSLTLLSSLAILSSQAMAWQPVDWRSLENTELNGGMLSKSANISNGWNAGAISSKLLVSDGGVRFKIPQLDQNISVGLNQVSYTTDHTEIDYAFYTNTSGKLFVYENGLKVIKVGDYQTSDLLSIERVGSDILYKQNGIVVHTTTNASTRPLIVDASIRVSGASINNCEVDNFVDEDTDKDGLHDAFEQSLIDADTNDELVTLADVKPQDDIDGDHLTNLVEYDNNTDILVGNSAGLVPIHWVNFSNTESPAATYPTGSDLKKISSVGWNADAIGAGGVLSDGGISFRVKSTTTKQAIGFSLRDSSDHRNDLAFSISTHENGNFYVYEEGVKVGKFGRYSLADTFSITRIGEVVSYAKNDVVFYVSEKNTSSPLLIDTSLHSSEAHYVATAVWGSSNVVDSDSDSLDDTWEIALINQNTTDSLTNLSTVLSEGDADTDGYSNLNEFQTGSDALSGIIDGTMLTGVNWVDVTQSEADLGTLVKFTEENVTRGWNAGARSRSVLEADGELQLVFMSGASRQLCGLSRASVGTNFDVINYGFYTREDGELFIYENGKKILKVGSYDTNDRCVIKRIGTSIIYYHNDVLVHTSTAASSDPLYVDSSQHTPSASINAEVRNFVTTADSDQDGLPDSFEQTLIDTDPNDSITNLADIAADGDLDLDLIPNIVEYAHQQNPLIANSSGWQSMVWTNFVNTEQSSLPKYQTGSDLIKTSTSDTWNADAHGMYAIMGDGGTSYRVSSSEGKFPRVICGFNINNDSQHRDDINYGIKVNPSGAFAVFENGERIGRFGFYDPLDAFSVNRIGDTVNYMKNGEVFYTSEVPVTSALLVDGTLRTANSQLQNTAIWGVNMAGDTDGDGLPDDWEQALIDADPNDDITSLADVTAEGDLDSDGLNNLGEYMNDLGGLDPDFDKDGLLDGTEVNGGQIGTAPDQADIGASQTDPKKKDNPKVKLFVQ